MIRIDEIYNNTFWPYISQHCPLTRMFFCDPPGRTDPDALFNFGEDVAELNYIFFHDQEPIHLDIHQPLFDDVARRNADLNHHFGAKHQAIITSEYNSEAVKQVCSQYKWQHYYYFFHGWAALDWYRGYDRAFLMIPPKQRTITHTFIAPNRIIAGHRQHRLLVLYHIFKNKLLNNWISCPEVCPAENVSVYEAVQPLKQIYQDIETVFRDQPLPISFPGETDHPMHSCWLSLFDECATSLLYLVTETLATGHRQQLTEKTFKPICLRMPFVIVGTCGSLQYLRSYGFKTFGDIWDESYDDEPDDTRRIERIATLLSELDAKSVEEKNAMFRQAQEIVEHNYNHFYNGTFEQVLWEELSSMLNQIKQDFAK